MAAALGTTAPVASAHDGGRPGYASSVTAVTPSLPGVEITVIDRDDRLRLVNRGAGEVVITGYDGEPYLRFTPDAVFRNANSPATHLNEDRYGEVALPASADPKAEPRWERVARQPIYEWHDHRIHWMSPIDPPQVRAAPDEAQLVFRWEVPGTADGEPLRIAGRLDYAPVDSGGPPWVYLALAIGAVALAGGSFALVRRHRARPVPER
jgi:hypothetical protein